MHNKTDSTNEITAEKRLEIIANILRFGILKYLAKKQGESSIIKDLLLDMSALPSVNGDTENKMENDCV